MLFPNWEAPSNIKAVTLCRNENLETLEKLGRLNQFKTPNHIAWLTQIHSNLAVQLDSTLFNKTDPYTNITADASYTTSFNIACAIRTADCLPILVTSEDGGWIAAVHAGWRGLANNIIENTIAKFKNQNTAHTNSNLIAWIGPAISKKHFEVGQDVYDAFVGVNSEDKVAFVQSINHIDRWFADLYLLAKLRLNRLNINKVFTDEYCTYSMPEQFYSYRRDNKTSDRLITMIWKNNRMER